MGRFADRRVWLGGGALVAALIAALGWFLLVSPGLASAHDLRAQAAETQQQNDALSLKAASLKAKSAHVATYTSALRTALDGVPYASGLPEFTRQVNAQATDHKVKVSSVAVGAVTPVVAASPTPSTAQSTDPAPSAAGTLFSMQVTLLSTGTLKDQLAFLTEVRTIGPRRALVTSTQVSPAATGTKANVDTDSSLTTQLTIFAAPRTPDQVKQLNKLLAGNLDG